MVGKSGVRTAGNGAGLRSTGIWRKAGWLLVTVLLGTSSCWAGTEYSNGIVHEYIKTGERLKNNEWFSRTLDRASTISQLSTVIGEQANLCAGETTTPVAARIASVRSLLDQFPHTIARPADLQALTTQVMQLRLDYRDLAVYAEPLITTATAHIHEATPVEGRRISAEVVNEYRDLAKRLSWYNPVNDLHDFVANSRKLLEGQFSASETDRYVQLYNNTSARVRESFPANPEQFYKSESDQLFGWLNASERIESILRGLGTVRRNLEKEQADTSATYKRLSARLFGEAHVSKAWCGPEFTTDTNVEIGIGDRLVVQLEGNLEDWVKQRQEKFPHYQQSLIIEKLVPVLDGVPIAGVHPELINPGDKAPCLLRFHLEYNDKNKSAWAAILGSISKNDGPKSVTVGFENGILMNPSPGSSQAGGLPAIKFRFASGPIENALVIILILILLLLWIYLIPFSNIMCDPIKRRPSGARMYSLARVQLAIWISVVAVSYVFLWILTKSTDTLNDSVLLILGISIATTLTSAVVDSKGQNLPQGGSNQDAPREKLTLHLILKDLLADGTDAPYDIHRVQIAIWTMVLVCIFIQSVYTKLVMPEFSTTLLGLMGISSGAFVGGKVVGQSASQQEADRAKAAKREEHASDAKANAG